MENENAVTVFPGNFGQDCPYNGETNAEICLCDECDWLMCCGDNAVDCTACAYYTCPRKMKLQSPDEICTLQW